MRTDCYVIKFGGSVITKKSGSYQLLDGVIKKIARILRKKSIDLPLIIIFGGGSFGNLAPFDYKVLERSDDKASKTLPMMTVVMFSMLSEITRTFVDLSLPVYPLQASALICADENGEITIDGRAITSIISSGHIPLITGDLIFNGIDKYEIFSSDNIPALLTTDFSIARALYYTDVEGVYESITSTTVVPYVDDSNLRVMQQAAGDSSNRDITGGMRNKLYQQHLLAQLGVESEVLSFERFENVDLSLKGYKHYGTVFLPG